MANDGALVSALAEARERVRALTAALRECAVIGAEGSCADCGHMPGTHDPDCVIGRALAGSGPALALKSPSDVMGWLTPDEANALQLEHDNKAIAWMAEVARLQTELKAIKPVIDTLCAAVDIYRAEQIAREAP